MTNSQPPQSGVEIAVPAAPAWPRFFSLLAERPLPVLAVLGLLLWLPGVIALPALDRDESRFAQSSRQMVESGDLVDIRFGHVPRYKKPVGIYWLQAASTAALGLGDDSRIWTYRVPSLIGGIAASWLTVWCALAFAQAETALVAGLLMLSSILLTAEATIATTDAVLLACVVAVQGVLLRVYRAARQPEAPRVSLRLLMLGWAAVGAGALVKFPVVPGVGLLTVVGLVAWDRQWRWLGMLKPLRGILLALAIASPWLVAITLQSHGAFLQESLGHDFAGKLAGGQESHGLPPGYYLALSALCFFPAILFVLPGLAFGIARRAEPVMRFLLIWAGGWWLVVEAVPTKLPHYVIDAYPALAILGALFVTTAAPVLRWPAWLTAARCIAGFQFVAGAGLLTAALVLAPRYFGDGPDYWLWGAAGLGFVLALASLVFSIRGAQVRSLLLSLLAMLIFVPALTVAAAPRLSQLWLTQRLKPLVAAASRPDDPPPALAGYQEPSMLFALGKDVVLTDGAGAAEAGAKTGGVALVEDAERGAFLARLAELQADARTLGDLRGFNYSRGRKVHVTLYRVAQLHELH